MKSCAHNSQALQQARDLNYQFKQPIYCAVNKDGLIFDLAIGSKHYQDGNGITHHVYDAEGKRKAEIQKERDTETKHNLTFTREGKKTADFTFTLDGEEYTGLFSCNDGAIRSYYRLPGLGIKARYFSNLVKAVKKLSK